MPFWYLEWSPQASGLAPFHEWSNNRDSGVTHMTCLGNVHTSWSFASNTTHERSFSISCSNDERCFGHTGMLGQVTAFPACNCILNKHTFPHVLTFGVGPGQVCIQPHWYRQGRQQALFHRSLEGKKVAIRSNALLQCYRCVGLQCYRCVVIQCYTCVGLQCYRYRVTMLQV